jgi:DNA repair exonuclease SbcCD ATPase subunit
LGRKGFRGEVLDHVTPYLNARTQHYLDALTGGSISAAWDTVSENSSGEYVENFHIKVAHESGVDRFQLLSGGEKRKVRLACALALQDLVATRAVKPIKLFIADEIDDAIDTAGLELLMGVLESKARTMGSVFIISHNDLADWVRNTLTITKRDGVSTFESR